MSNLLPIEDLPNQYAFSRCISHPKNIGPKILAAISIIAALGTIFIFLAAYNFLPAQNNLISDMGLWGKITAGGLLTATIVGIVASIWLDRKLRPSNELPPAHIVSETQSSITANSDPSTVPDSSCDFSILSEWCDERPFSSRPDIFLNIKNSYNAISLNKISVECDAEFSSLFAVLCEWKEDAAENQTEFSKREAAAHDIMKEYQAVRSSPATTIIVPPIPKTLRSILREWVNEAKDDTEFGSRGLNSKDIRRCYHMQDEKLVLENFTSLPDIFDYFGHLKALTLRRFSLSIWPPSLSNLKNLNSLVFAECKSLEVLPAPVCALPSLKRLDLYWCSSKVPDNIDQLSNLEHLDLTFNRIEELPGAIGKLQNLKKLVLDCNLLTTLPKCIENLKALELLKINNNCFQTLPGWLFEMPSLSLICAESNKFSHETATDIIVQILKQRTYAGSLIACKISSLPAKVEQQQPIQISDPSNLNHDFEAFPALEEWVHEVTDDKIKQRADICKNIERCYAQIPLGQITCESAEMIAHMYPMLEEWIDDGLNHEECQKRMDVAEKIIKIYIARRQQALQNYTNSQLPWPLLKIPKELRFMLRQWVSEAKDTEHYLSRKAASRKIRICYRRQIKSLWLDEVSSLPDIFDYLKHVETINLCDCGRLFGNLLPDSFQRLQNLRALSLSLCEPFESLPESICNLPNLEELAIVRCNLTSVPNNIDLLSNLTRLTLCRNRITRLSESVRKLNKLNYLDLSDNLLTTLPEFIVEFDNLQTLNISHNFFEFLPDCLLVPPSIATLLATNNRFSYETVIAINQRMMQMREGGLNLDWVFSVDSHPEPSNVALEEIIVFWEKQFQETFPSAEVKQQIFIKLTAHKKKNFLAVFLSKAKDCKDFKTSARSLMILEIHEMLHAAENHEPFREELFILVEEGDDACSDKVAVFLNYVRGHRLISQAENLSDLSLAKLVIGIERLDQLDSAVRKMSHLSVDPLELILKFQITLRDVLSLPVITQNMLFPHLGVVSDEKIEKVKKEVLSKTSDFASILISSTQWVTSIQKNHLADFEKIKAKYICPEADSFTNEAAYINASNTMKIQREQAIQEAILKFTQEWLAAHPLFLKQEI